VPAAAAASSKLLDRIGRDSAAVLAASNDIDACRRMPQDEWR
jgi:hypothetical protein